MNKLLVVMTLALMLNCTRSKAPMEPQGVAGEEYAVYRAVLNRWHDDGTHVVVMPDSTADYVIENPDHALEHLPGLEPQTITAFNAANVEKTALHPFIGSRLKCYVVNRRDIPSVFDLKTRYPDAQALAEISRVGFNAEQTQALVYGSLLWAPLAGVGNLFLLVKENDWRIAATWMVWIS